ncbi:MAG: helix-turn-helix domain-containing protein [Bacteroidetes bacterium]|nr:helix-turn-helix domain-containing protein [Bacteroidota bacterium]
MSFSVGADLLSTIFSGASANHTASSEAFSPVADAQQLLAAIEHTPHLVERLVHALAHLLQLGPQDLLSTLAPARPPAPSEEPPVAEIMSRKDVAAYMKMSLRYVDGLIKEGKLVPIRLGNRVRFSRKTVDAFLRLGVQRGRPVLTSTTGAREVAR